MNPSCSGDDRWPDRQHLEKDVCQMHVRNVAETAYMSLRTYYHSLVWWTIHPKPPKRAFNCCLILVSTHIHSAMYICFVFGNHRCKDVRGILNICMEVNSSYASRGCQGWFGKRFSTHKWHDKWKIVSINLDYQELKKLDPSLRQIMQGYWQAMISCVHVTPLESIEVAAYLGIQPGTL